MAKKKAKDPLAEALVVFARGDYAQAAGMFAQLEADPELSEGAKQQAATLRAATKVERGALFVGLASVTLILIVVVVTTLTQPG